MELDIQVVVLSYLLWVIGNKMSPHVKTGLRMRGSRTWEARARRREAGIGMYLPVEADGASLLGLHTVVF